MEEEMPVGYSLIGICPTKWAQLTSDKRQQKYLVEKQGKINLICYLSKDKIQVLHDTTFLPNKEGSQILHQSINTITRGEKTGRGTQASATLLKFVTTADIHMISG
jgi:cell division protein FtsW (lipid II flippase)